MQEILLLSNIDGDSEAGDSIFDGSEILLLSGFDFNSEAGDPSFDGWIE